MDHLAVHEGSDVALAQAPAPMMFHQKSLSLLQLRAILQMSKAQLPAQTGLCLVYSWGDLSR